MTVADPLFVDVAEVAFAGQMGCVMLGVRVNTEGSAKTVEVVVVQLISGKVTVTLYVPADKPVNSLKVSVKPVKDCNVPPVF